MIPHSAREFHGLVHQLVASSSRWRFDVTFFSTRARTTYEMTVLDFHVSEFVEYANP
jgi:hypothetical protein